MPFASCQLKQCFAYESRCGKVATFQLAKRSSLPSLVSQRFACRPVQQHALLGVQRGLVGLQGPPVFWQQTHTSLMPPRPPEMQRLNSYAGSSGFLLPRRLHPWAAASAIQQIHEHYSLCNFVTLRCKVIVKRSACDRAQRTAQMLPRRIQRIHFFTIAIIVTSSSSSSSSRNLSHLRAHASLLRGSVHRCGAESGAAICSPCSRTFRCPALPLQAASSASRVNAPVCFGDVCQRLHCCAGVISTFQWGDSTLLYQSHSPLMCPPCSQWGMQN